MKLALIGFPGSGKTTLFNALTGQDQLVGVLGEFHKAANIGIVKVPDWRLDYLSNVYKPPKVVYARVHFVDQGFMKGEKERKRLGEEFLSNIRAADALVHVVRCFDHPVLGKQDPLGDIEALESELILADYMVVEKRLERLEHETKKGKKPDSREFELLKEALAMLENEEPLRCSEKIVKAQELKGYAFLSAKPMILLLNEEEDSTVEIDDQLLKYPYGAKLFMKAKLEMELSQLSPEEAEEFMAGFGITELAREKLIEVSYGTLDLISFFTIGSDEVKAWTVKRGTTALKAAGTVHTDMERGFIRAEVVSFEDFRNAGSYQNAQKVGKVRLEGREYVVKDGDIITFRFNL